MKKILLVLLVATSGVIFSQNNQAGETNKRQTTTDEEYNYLTKGYEISLETGSDIKSGYKLNKFKENIYDNYTIEYYSFDELKTAKTKCILIVLKKEKSKKDKAIYLCLPFNNQNLYQKFTKQKESLGLSMLIYLDYSIYALFSQTIELISNDEKNHTIY